jgi:hypothetical protein
VIEVLKHAGFEVFGEHEIYFGLSGEKLTDGEALEIADNFLHGRDI